MRRYIFYLCAGLLLLAGTSGCAVETEKDEPIVIALSKGYPDSLYVNYYKWLESADSNVKCIDMYALPIDSAMKAFRNCAGLVLTGGTDINPAFYNKAYDTVRCWPIDDHRDLLELRLIDSAIAWGKPVLGICRGHQVLNVALGGSLIVDIPSDYDTLIEHQCDDYLACFHNVMVDTLSLLHGISGLTGGQVNSNHHQAAFLIAPELKAVAFASDGLIEALEWKDPVGKSFLLGVQWHPERMDLSNPLSFKIRESFLEECRQQVVGSQKSAVGGQ